ncbi:leptin receptor isoform X2 [Pangasianodon hypophthalmus]|uniref:leptin receptor isoform X1 n=1 Tax=Pangasianodon hypophthalmus TaxID=310915 RepID=UPI0023076630|nr:leptin receptor isoform X1 [Pangasianodon hypophthalmus]XP_053087548.1 leptin receptor isoform X1 [Pangasianodon hypophthalmus]XP_053087552.1 leptin receptor isoform X2 [Pangasianodon hypophthalmus]XP_053087556.1 leptin receptor isoform X2 [Pangasianodon hypophthalmus]XP_053087562.1 leptin receptor isoform X2 [Pangasianodon hypophthalmus]
MFSFVRLFVIVNVFTTLHVAVAVSPLNGLPGVYQNLQWRAQLCCALTSNGKASEASTSSNVHNQSLSHVNSLQQYQCHIQNSTNITEDSSVSQVVSENIRLDIRCWLEDKRANVICYLKLQRATAPDTSQLIISLRRVALGADTLSDETNITTQVQCPGEDEITCLFALDANDVSMSLSVSGFLSGRPLLAPEMHISTDLLRKPDAPFHLRYNVTTEGEVMIAWNDSQNNKHPLYYELRYSSNTSLTHWEVLNVQHPWVSLSQLTSGVRYTVQVRCKSLHHLHYWSEWSDWSQPFYLTLDVSYIPAEEFTRPGAEITVYSVLHNHSWAASKAVWMLNGQMLPESQYRMINERVSAVTIRSKEPGFDTLMCCYPWGERYKCSIAYTKVYVEGFFDANITCQTDQRLRVDSMTCKWNKSAWAVIRFLYRSYMRMCEEIPHEEGTMTQTHEETISGVEECPDGTGDYRECTLRDLSLFSCYKLWLVVEGSYNKVRSLPVFVSPIDYVKPSPPSDLEAVTLPNKTLSVSWKRPHLPAYNLQYKLRYVPMHGMADLQWKVFGPLFESWATILVQDPCIQYKVEVRCRRLNGSGYWSDWSKAHASLVYSIKAPEMGPDFWRIIQETPASYNNVTLLFKPLPAEEPASCVQGLVVMHQTSGGNVWSDDIAPSTFYTFQWREEVHSITVMSRNSLGSSAKNSNMTLVRQPKRQCVRWFHVAANASCVFLSWSLVGEQPLLLSFVLEWLELSGDSSQGWTSAGRVEWLRVASNTRDLQLCRPFYGTEEFKLYPVFVDGEGEPVRCTAVRSDPAAYMLLMIIAFLFVVLLVTLIISQNQLKKLMWKDVPNPNNCSWAKGRDFKKLDGNLFGHQEGLTACPLLPMSENACEVEIVEKLFVLEEDQEDKALLHHSVDTEGQSTNLSSIEGSLEPLSLDTSTVAASPETSGQSSVTYSTVLVFDQPVLQRKQQESLSSSSDEGNFSANNSDISGSFPGGLCELEIHSSSDGANPRNSCSYNSVEEFSETSEQEDEASESTQVSKELYYMGMNEEGEEDELEEEFKEEDGTEEQIPDSSPELDCKNSKASDSNVPLYLPQFRTAANKLLRETVGDSTIQL